MKTNYTYKTSNVCAMAINFDIEDDVISNVSFYGGCNGNLKAISKLVDGMTVDQIEGYLKGNTCGPRPTSCADQLARAVREAYKKTKAAN
ncbi:MAG: TIGR03905 family TSCPD domain-containing protein [Lachnospiraceae bacterium]|nr:TIGR03905 family TSCPD domain-containing protein [Lachnospiraceae bacterium]